MGEITHVYIPGRILRMDLTIVERLILALAVSFGQVGIIMSNNALATGLNVSRRSVIRAVRTLKGLGLLCECGSREGHKLIARADLHEQTGDKKTPAVVPDCHQVVSNSHPTGDILSPITKGTEDNYTLSRERGTFIAPTLEEVRRYIAEKKLDVDAAAFHSYFAEGGWVDSHGRKVRNWQQKLHSWHSHGKGRSNGKRDDGIVRSFGHLTSKYGESFDNRDDSPVPVRAGGARPAPTSGRSSTSSAAPTGSSSRTSPHPARSGACACG